MSTETPYQARDRLMAQVRAIRLAEGRSIRGVAARTGLRRTHLSDLERGRGSPTLTTFMRIAGELGYVVELRPVAGAAA